MRFVNHSFGDGPQVVSQISDLLRYDTRSTTVVGRHTRNYNSEVPAHVLWTVSCRWQYLRMYAGTGTFYVLLPFYRYYVGTGTVTCIRQYRQDR